MSLEGDTADKLVHEGIEITEAALKLAGLGAKNLAALLLALLKDNEKLKGKTSMNTLLRQDRQLSVFHVKKEDMGKFKELAGRYGVLFAATYHKHQDKGICDVLVKADDAARVNRILEKLEYPAPAKEADTKNAAARAQQNDRSKGRGLGWMPKVRTVDPVKKYAKKTGPLESLGAETLTAMVLKVASENREQGHAAPLAELLAGKDLRILPVQDMDVLSLQKSAAKLDVPLTFLPGSEPGQHHMLARENDAPIIGWLFEQAGYPLPTWPKDAPVKAKQEKTKKSAAEKTSVKTKVEQAKNTAKVSSVRTRPQPTRAARPVR
ncbi:PcfB family protein [Ruminococcaceae bacterium OttesenSCG-928-A16]|nr:PcfB family protein [Ruminococcaceae bacterium OttesenSCG-928-A16]